MESADCQKESLDVIVYTGGTFDMFNRGHVRFLKACRDLAGESGLVVVALNQDDFIEQFKKRKPICSFEERHEVLSACRYVNRVIPNWGGADSKPAILNVMPYVIAIGSDWKPPRDYHAQMQFTSEWLDQHDIQLVFIDRDLDISTTQIRGRFD